MILIAELSTNHGGDVDLACDMVRQAAEAGATYAKIQSYSLARLNPADPQKDWLTQAHLDEDAHVRIMAACAAAGIKFLSTPFDPDSLKMLRSLGVREFKIASSESGNDWWQDRSEDTPAGESWFVSWPWGLKDWKGLASVMDYRPIVRAHLSAIPLYPTPPECVGRVQLLDGYSDHTVGIAACQWAIANGAKVIEAHMRLEGRGRQCVWDKTPEQIRQLRAFADDCETMTSGVATRFRRRWQA